MIRMKNVSMLLAAVGLAAHQDSHDFREFTKKFVAQFDTVIMQTQDGEFSRTVNSSGHFFSKWVNSSGHFLRVNSRGYGANTVGEPMQGVWGEAPSRFSKNCSVSGQWVRWRSLCWVQQTLFSVRVRLGQVCLGLGQVIA